jgi:hypothetical protein
MFDTRSSEVEEKLPSPNIERWKGVAVALGKYAIIV